MRSRSSQIGHAEKNISVIFHFCSSTLNSDLITCRWVRQLASQRRLWAWPSWLQGRPSPTSLPVWSWPVKVWGTWLCPALWAVTSSTSLWGELQRLMCLSWKKKMQINFSLSPTFLSLTLSLCLKVFQSRGSCTRPSTVLLQWPSAATGSSVPSYCSSSCSSLSSSPSRPVSGRWIRRWVSRCSCSISSFWCLAWCWRIESLPALFLSECTNRGSLYSRRFSSPVTSGRTVNPDGSGYL